MTTAHRPTFEAARGGQGYRERDLSAQSKQYSSRDLPAHTRLKYRQGGQGTVEEARSRDFRRELEERERRHRVQRSGVGDADDEAKRPRLMAGEESATTSSSASLQAVNPDADDLAVAAVDLDDDEDDDDDEDEEDETQALMAELAKIKRERAAEAAKREAERQAEEERIRTENILRGNPLRNKQQKFAAGAGAAAAAAAAPDFKVKRRWNDDVVFKNCARDEVDADKRGFVNDTLRSEFHKKFMDKYIK